MDNDSYLTITNTISEGFYSEKRSKFYAFAHHVESVDEIKQIVKGYRQKYHDARHCCYAYRILPDNLQIRSNDDGEPSGTAGKPIMGQIESKQLVNVLVVVVRYYGGVNLGTGGLIQAYRTAACEALDHAEIVNKFIEEQITYNFAYPLINDVMRIIKETGAVIKGQNFDNTCTIQLSIRKNKAPELKSRLAQLAFK